MCTACIDNMTLFQIIVVTACSICCSRTENCPQTRSSHIVSVYVLIPYVGVIYNNSDVAAQGGKIDVKMLNMETLNI